MRLTVGAGALCAVLLIVMGGAGRASALGTVPGHRISHVTTGTVKSLSATTLVLARGKKRREMTFELGPDVPREGRVEVGANISIRYVEDGRRRVATGITVRPAR